LLRLAYLHGLKAEAIGRIVPACDIETAGTRLEDRLKDVESALRDLLLVPKGHFTTRAEAVRDGKEDPRAAMGVLVPRMNLLAERMLRSETRYVSRSAGDMVSTVFLTSPSRFPLNSREAMAYVRKIFEHLLTDYFRKRQLIGTLEQLDERKHPGWVFQEVEGLSPDVRVEVDKAIDEICRCYSGTPDLDEFLLDRLLGGDSVAKLAEAYGIGESTARNRANDLCVILRERLQRRAR
jgi:DNA-directed RNA polymerase specialized sigma24 family protein